MCFFISPSIGQHNYMNALSLCTHLCERLLLGDVSVLGRFLATRLGLVLLAEADRSEGPLFLLEIRKPV